MTHAQRIRRQARKGAVLTAIKGRITAREVAQRVEEIPLRTVRVYLRELEEEGPIEQVGSEVTSAGGNPAPIYARESEQ